MLREHGAVPYRFEPGDPQLLRHQDHIGCHVFMVRNPDKNVIDPVFLETCGNYAVEDPVCIFPVTSMGAVIWLSCGQCQATYSTSHQA